MRFFLIRCGESQADVTLEPYHEISDHIIGLTPEGMEQSQEVGHLLKEYLQKHPAQLGGPAVNNVANGLIQNLSALFGSNQDVLKQMQNTQKQLLKSRLWNSPYRRARETAQIIKGVVGGAILDQKEDVLLCEQQFGMLKTAENAKCFAHAEAQLLNYGKFWYRQPMGESPLDVVCRLRQYLAAVKRDEEDHGVSDNIVVFHGTTLRLFTMVLLNKHYEWFDCEPKPGNCAIRLIEQDHSEIYIDRGYIYGGHLDGDIWTYNGNNADSNG